MTLRGVLAALALLAGCGGPVVDAGGEGIQPTASALVFDPDLDGAQNPDGVWRYDRFTTCTAQNVGPQGHCCPNGFAMIGFHAGRNVLKCALVHGGLVDSYIDRNGQAPGACRWGDTCTVRMGIHTCKPGWVMIGLNAAANDFVCARPQAQTLNMWSEWLDPPPPYGAQDKYPMHVCQRELGNPLTAAMTGLHIALNRLGCAE